MESVDACQEKCNDLGLCNRKVYLFSTECFYCCMLGYPCLPRWIFEGSAQIGVRNARPQLNKLLWWWWMGKMHCWWCLIHPTYVAVTFQLYFFVIFFAMCMFYVVIVIYLPKFEENLANIIMLLHKQNVVILLILHGFFPCFVEDCWERVVLCSYSQLLTVLQPFSWWLSQLVYRCMGLLLVLHSCVWQ